MNMGRSWLQSPTWRKKALCLNVTLKFARDFFMLFQIFPVSILTFFLDEIKNINHAGDVLRLNQTDHPRRLLSKRGLQSEGGADLPKPIPIRPSVAGKGSD